MDNPENTGNIGYTGHKSRTTNIREYTRCNQKWTILRHWQHRVHRTQVKETNIREYTRSNQKWTILRKYTGHKSRKTNIRVQSEMDNPELVTQGTQDTSQTNNREYTRMQSEMDNPETLATQGTQDTSQGQQTLENTQGAIRNGQS